MITRQADETQRRYRGKRARASERTDVTMGPNSGDRYGTAGDKKKNGRGAIAHRGNEKTDDTAKTTGGPHYAERAGSIKDIEWGLTNRTSSRGKGDKKKGERR